jgi:hypothetical protein
MSIARHDLGVSEDDAVAGRPVVEPPRELTLDSELEAGAFRVIGDGRRLYDSDATTPVQIRRKAALSSGLSSGDGGN